LSITKLIAPFVPFLAESLWQHLSKPVAGRVRQSVHLCDFPTPETSIIHPTLASCMSVLREIASLGRSARMDAKLKVRQPLSRVEVTLTNTEHAAWLEDHDDIVREELNVKEIHYAGGSSPYIEYLVQPNFRRLGPRVGGKLPKVKAALSKADGASLLQEMTSTGKISLIIDEVPLDLDGEDIQVRLQAKSGWAAAQGKGCVVVLATELTDELLEEGLARDFVRLVQDLRKTRSCRFSDRIGVYVQSDDPIIQKAIQNYYDYIAGETLAVTIEVASDTPHGIELQPVELADSQVKIGLQVTDR
jgi:isoleucyl-tRNA synthetase